eukprot:m.123512 g.123512  ORF g.123512 m.123512 type:complete len:553 (-) comp22018_c0_seq1:183-1841(-)
MGQVYLDLESGAGAENLEVNEPSPQPQDSQPVRKMFTAFHQNENESDIKEFETDFDRKFNQFTGAQRYGTCSRQAFRLQALSFSEVLNAFVQVDVSVWLSFFLSCVLIWFCLKYEIFWNMQVGLIISAIVFPLAFSINESYRRRERVLDEMATFMGAASELYWLHRDWTLDSGLPESHPQDVEQDINDLLINLIHYVATEIPNAARSQRLGAVYRVFSRLAKNNDLIRTSVLGNNGPLLTRLIHYHATIVTSFERMRVVREYRTPRGIRGYTKLVVFLLPIILAPFFAFQSRDTAMRFTEYAQRSPVCQNDNPWCGNTYQTTDHLAQNWSAYFSAFICAMIFGSLQAVQDTLDDPFDGVGQDDIDLHLITAWAPSALWTDEKHQRIPVLETTKSGCTSCSSCNMCSCCATVYTEFMAQPKTTDDLNADAIATPNLPPSLRRATMIADNRRASMASRRPTGYPRPNRTYSGTTDDEDHVEGQKGARRLTGYARPSRAYSGIEDDSDHIIAFPPQADGRSSSARTRASPDSPLQLGQTADLGSGYLIMDSVCQV